MLDLRMSETIGVERNDEGNVYLRYAWNITGLPRLGGGRIMRNQAQWEDVYQKFRKHHSIMTSRMVLYVREYESLP